MPSKLVTISSPTGIFLAQRGGISHCTTSSSSRREARSDCKCHLEWQALQPDARSDGARGTACLSQAIWAPSGAQLGEKRGKNGEEKKFQTCCQQSPVYSQCSGFAFKTLAGHSKKAIPHRASRLWGKRLGQGEGARVPEPVQALPQL